MSNNVIHVTITDPSGPPGPPGPPGPKGDPGTPISYLHTQTSPLDTWTINHNLGFKPQVSVYDAGSVEVLAQIVHISDNQVLVYFSIPTAGFARLI